MKKERVTTDILYELGFRIISDLRCTWIDWGLEGLEISSDVWINEGGFNWVGVPIDYTKDLIALILCNDKYL